MDLLATKIHPRKDRLQSDVTREVFTGYSLTQIRRLVQPCFTTSAMKRQRACRRYCSITGACAVEVFVMSALTTTFTTPNMELEGVQSLEQECIQAFRNADENGKGFLCPSDYKVAVLELCGYKPSKYEINAVWSKFAPPANSNHVAAVGSTETSLHDGMDQATFVSLMVERLRQKDKDELIRQVFISFDVHLRGFITTSDCVEAFKEVTPSISEELIGRWFDEVDSDSDGRVTFRDFEMMMKSFLLVSPLSHGV